MAIQSINQLKAWFHTQAEPTQQQFRDWLDSYRHKSEKIVIDDLSTDLQATFYPHSYRQITTATDVTINPEDEVVMKSYDGPAGNFTFTLPPAASVPAGKSIIVGDDNGVFIGTFGIIIAAAPGETINGAASAGVFYTPKFSVTLISDGLTGWHYDAATLRLSGAAGNLNMGAHNVVANQVLGSSVGANDLYIGPWTHLNEYSLEVHDDFVLQNVGGDGGAPAFRYRHSDGQMMYYGPQRFNYYANGDASKFVRLDADGYITNAQVQYSDIAGTPASGEDPSLKQDDLTHPDSSHYPTTNAVATALATKADLVNGKVPLSQINDALIGNVHYKGLYSFSTGVISSDDSALNGQPLPTAATANAGWYFIAQDSGMVDGTSFTLGDWLISNGALGWHKVDNTDAVSSVNGYTGNVSLTKADVGLSNVPNTDATNPANIVQTASYRLVSDAEKVTWNSKQAPATTLAGYGITDAVDLSNAQTITGIKTWASGANSVAIGPNKMYVQITDNMYFNTVSDIRFGCNTLYLNGNNGIISQQSIFFEPYKGISFTNAAGGYTALLSAATPVAAGYTVRLPNASGTIALVGDIPTSAAWSTITGTPTTLAGYGIADAYPLTGNPSGFLTAVPDLSGTYVTTGSNQTVGGLKTFSNQIINQGTASASAGLQSWMAIQPTISQTGSATYSALTIQPFENAIAGNTNYLLNIGKQSAANGGGTFTQLFSIRSNGKTAIGAANTSSSLLQVIASSNNNGNGSWGTTGIMFSVVPGTLTDIASSGTVATTTAINSFGIPALAANNTTTFTTAANVYIAGAPTASTNVTITNPYALYVASGQIAAVGGLLTSPGSGSNSNFLTNANQSIGAQSSNSISLFAGASFVHFRSTFAGSATSVLGSTTSYTNLLIASAPVTTAASGTHALLANVVINPIGTVTSGGATVTNTASLFIGGAGSGGTNNYALYVAGGTAFFTSTVQALQYQAVIQAADPTTSNIAAGTYQVYKNTTSGAVKLWYNDGGTLKSVSLT